MKSLLFQAEGGIRDMGVTGVQTCALPICRRSWGRRGTRARGRPSSGASLRDGEREQRAVLGPGGLVDLRPGAAGGEQTPAEVRAAVDGDAQDRKSTRLNSSHANISYAVFCLKKKNAFPALRPSPRRDRSAAERAGGAEARNGRTRRNADRPLPSSRAVRSAEHTSELQSRQYL